MIQEINDDNARESAVVYRSTLSQVKMLYERDPELAGELAISALELALTGRFSSTNVAVRGFLQPMSEIVTKDIEKYNRVVNFRRTQKIRDLHLDRVAELYKQNKSQKEIARLLTKELGENISQQNVSYRLSVITSDYPELL